MSDLPEEAVSSEWAEKELKVNLDRRSGVSAGSPSEAVKRIRK
jgi:hypothetical protein